MNTVRGQVQEFVEGENEFDNNFEVQTEQDK